MTTEGANCAEKFGLDASEAKAGRDIPPSFSFAGLKPGETAKFKLLENEPRDVQFQDTQSKELIKRKVITARDLNAEMDVTLWLSAKSLKMSLWQINEQLQGKLKGSVITITKRAYKHPKYGNCVAYNAGLVEIGEGK